MVLFIKIFKIKLTEISVEVDGTLRGMEHEHKQRACFPNVETEE